MAKINFNNIDWEDDDESASYEKFTKSNRKPSQNEDDVFEPSGKPRRGRKGDSFISQRTKSRT